MKKMTHFFSAAILLAMFTGSVYGQHEHSDIELGYDNLATPSALEIEEVEVTTDGIMFFEAEFELINPFDPNDFLADEPGFTTNDAEGLLVNAGDQIWMRALDASTNSAHGEGYVNFYNPLNDSLSAAGRISVIDNTGGTADLVLNGGSIESGPNEQFLGIGDAGGDIHDHVVFDLLDDATAPLGAYGIMFQLQSDFDPADGNMDLTSDAFWIIFNHGMDEEAFENFALPAFGAGSAIPEPGSAMVLLLGTAVLGMRRRQRS